MNGKVLLTNKIKACPEVPIKPVAMQLRITISNLNEKLLNASVEGAKASMQMEGIGTIDVLDNVPEVLEIDANKLPQEVLLEIVSGAVLGFALSSWMKQHDLNLSEE